MKTTRIFFDTEFTGLHKDTSLISIGLIADSGESFYGVITDYDKTQLNKWLEDNVVKYLDIKEQPNNMYCRDTRQNVGMKLKQWLQQFETIEWVSDVCHYDFVLLIDLVYNNALNIPYKKHCSACHDINQDIAKYFDISEIEAFDVSREGILSSWDVKVEGDKHNALYDAKVIKEIFNLLN